MKNSVKSFQFKFFLSYVLVTFFTLLTEYFLHGKPGVKEVSIIIGENVILFLLLYFLMFRKWIIGIQSATKKLTKNSSQTLDYTEKLFKLSNVLAKETNDQSAAVVDTLASVDEISAMINQTAGNSNTALKDAETTHSESVQGKNVVEEMQTSMDEIEASNKELESLSNIIEEINAKTNVINDIVFETRLLSFNASIEAARAGQHGKGFAVVAEEVGNLANMSGRAATEISTLLNQSVEQVNNTIQQITNKVQIGIDISQKCASVFNEITVRIENLIPVIKSIATAANEQELGVNQIQKAMREIDDATNKNSSSAKETNDISTFLQSYFQDHLDAIEKLQSILAGSNDAQIDELDMEVDTPAKKEVKRTPPKRRVETKTPAKANRSMRAKADKPAPKKEKVEQRPKEEKVEPKVEEKKEAPKSEAKTENKTEVKETVAKTPEVKEQKAAPEVKEVKPTNESEDHALQGFPSSDDPRFED